MNNKIEELLIELRRFIDLDIDLNQEENKQYIRALIEQLENENNEDC